MHTTFKYFCFVVIIHSGFCQFGFDTEGGVVVSVGFAGTIGNSPALSPGCKQKLDEAFQKYSDDRVDPANSATWFVVPEGISYSFTVRLDNDNKSAKSIHVININLSGKKVEEGGKAIDKPIEGLTYTKTTSFMEVSGQLIKKGDILPETALKAGIEHIKCLVNLLESNGTMNKKTPLGFRAHLVNGKKEGNATGVYLFFGLFISTE